MSLPPLSRFIAAGCLALLSWNAVAQGAGKAPNRPAEAATRTVDVRANDITAVSAGGGDASVTIGGIEDGADVRGVTVVNSRVSIDGQEVPPNVTRYKSPRTGTVYQIQRKNGSVSVTTEGKQ